MLCCTCLTLSQLIVIPAWPPSLALAMRAHKKIKACVRGQEERKKKEEEKHFLALAIWLIASLSTFQLA